MQQLEELILHLNKDVKKYIYKPKALSYGFTYLESTTRQELAEEIQEYIKESMPIWKEVYSGVEEMEVAVMGCVVNGPGESKAANIGISLPGTFEEPKAPVYMDGEHYTTLKGDHIGEEFRAILNDYIIRNYNNV